MTYKPEIALWKDEIAKNEQGHITHHPLNSIYYYSAKSKGTSYGHLTFAGHDLAESDLFDDVQVFHLEFFGEPLHILDREAWADPLRADILRRLSPDHHAWYLSCVGTYLSEPDSSTFIVKELQNSFFGGQQPKFVVVQSEKKYGYGLGFHSRLFLEIPNLLLPDIVRHYWPRAIPGWPLEGYNMPSGQIERLYEWDKLPRDAHLFRQVMDQVLVAFYTHPSEHRHFAFVTCKLDLDDIKQLIDIESLTSLAQEICAG